MSEGKAHRRHDQRILILVGDQWAKRVRAVRRVPLSENTSEVNKKFGSPVTDTTGEGLYIVVNVVLD